MDTSGKVAVIFLQPRCNMSCSFCITEDHFEPASLDQLKELLLCLWAQGFRNVVFGGGEPLIWPDDLIGLTAFAKRVGFLVQVGSNMIAAPDGFELIPTIDRYVIPLESVDPSVHNAMRFYNRRHHALILGRLEKLKTVGKSVTISTIMTKVNIAGISALAEFLKDLNQPRPFLHAWHLYKFLPFGRGGAVHARTLEVTDADYEQAVSVAKNAGCPFEVFKRKDMYASQNVDFFWFENGAVRSRSKKGFLDPYVVPRIRCVV